MPRIKRGLQLVAGVLAVAVILMQFTPTEGLAKLCVSVSELGGICPTWFIWQTLRPFFLGWCAAFYFWRYCMVFVARRKQGKTKNRSQDPCCRQIT